MYYFHWVLKRKCSINHFAYQKIGGKSWALGLAKLRGILKESYIYETELLKIVEQEVNMMKAGFIEF